MSRQAVLLLFVCLMMAASGTADVSPPSVPSSPPAPSQGKGDEPTPGVHVRSLGGNGWALKIDGKMLIFDYVGRTAAPEGTPPKVRNLEAGYLDPGELAGLDVYVFVTHPHQDHFDPTILEWQGQVPSLKYFFGWQAGADSAYHCMVEPRAHEQCGAVEVWTIDSQSDVPEVAYLVKVDGITIYHNGDYRGSYVEDFEYLHSVTDHLDVAFVIGWPYPEHQHFRQAALLADIFAPRYMFAMCREGDEDKGRQFAELLAQRGVGTPVLYAQHRGAEFLCSRDATE